MCTLRDLPRILNYLVETLRTFVSDATIVNHMGFKIFAYAPCTAFQDDRQKVFSGFTLVKASTGVTALGDRLLHDHREYSRTLTFDTDFLLTLSSSPGFTTKDQSTSTSDLVLVDPLPAHPTSSMTSSFAPHSPPISSEHTTYTCWWTPSASTAAAHTSSTGSGLRRADAFNYGHQPPLTFGTGSSAPIFSFVGTGASSLQKPP